MTGAFFKRWGEPHDKTITFIVRRQCLVRPVFIWDGRDRINIYHTLVRDDVTRVVTGIRLFGDRCGRVDFIFDVHKSDDDDDV